MAEKIDETKTGAEGEGQGGEGAPQNVNISQEQGRDKGTQTSKEKSDESAGDSKGSEEGAGETGSRKEGEGSGEGTGEEKDNINPDTKKPYTADEWRDKFRNSAKGAQDLLDQKKVLEGTVSEREAKITDLEKEIVQLREIAEGKNPEGLKLADLQAELAKVTNESALTKEERMLDQFEKAVPLASTVREALKNLARANPKESLQKLYDENLKAGAEAKSEKAKQDDDKRNKGASDKGKGTSTREPSGDTVKTPSGYDTGLSLEEFNKLPIEKRRELLAK